MSTAAVTMTAKAHAFLEPKGNQLGFASVTINDAFAINGVKIMDSKNGPFVAMPSARDSRSGDFKDICFPTTKEGREALNTVVMDAYNSDIQQKIAGLSDRATGKDPREGRPSAVGKLAAAKKEVASNAPPLTDKDAPKLGADAR